MLSSDRVGFYLHKYLKQFQSAQIIQVNLKCLPSHVSSAPPWLSGGLNREYKGQVCHFEGKNADLGLGIPP